MKVLNKNIVFALLVCVMSVACKTNSEPSGQLENTIDSEETYTLEIVADNEGMYIEDLYSEDISIQTRIEKLAENNVDILKPVNANIPEVTKRDENMYFFEGSIPTGEGDNSTAVFLDIKNNKIYISNLKEGVITILGEDQIYPEVVKEWFK